MKKALLLMSFLFVLVISCGKETYVETVVKQVVTDYSLKDFPEYQKFLEEEVAMCGKGVIDPQKREENLCKYSIKVSAEAMTGFKTGLLHDKDNDHQGKQWMMPTEKEMAEVPEAWDIRDEFPETKNVAVNRQQCGDCWSQSTTKAFELMIAAYDKKIVPLSVQTQINNCQPDYGSCNGGYMTAPQFLMEVGNPLESQDPYRGVTYNCSFSSAELKKGFEYKLKSAPWVGSSFAYGKKPMAFRGNNAKQMIAMMYKYKSPLLVTVNAYDISGDAIYSSCSAVNSYTNHMVVVVGWETVNGEIIAHVWNSWGKSHGLNGISRIKWECGGPGKLNRSLGQEARVYVYEPKCANQPDALTGPNQTIIKTSPGVGVKIGVKAKPGQTCHWLPETGLDDPNSCNPFAAPGESTEYNLTAKTECGEATALVQVNVLKR